MKQLILEIDDITEAKMSAAAKAAGLSNQQWLHQLIEEKTAANWPDSIKVLVGAWRSTAFPEKINEKD